MNKKSFIYLDNNSTTPVDPRVLESMMPYYQDRFGNASSDHSFGWIAKSAVENSRETIARFLNADPKEIYFTSGATESINIVHFGIAESDPPPNANIISSNIEHSASFDSLNNLSKKGFEIKFVPVNKLGLIEPEQLINSIDNKTILVSIIYANNEIGTINDIKTIGDFCKSRNIFFHIDATQAIGKISFNLNELNVDFVSFTAHKIYGPKGIGGLFIRNRKPNIKLSQRIFGGGQENGIRPGTLNVPAIVGFGKAIEICSAELEKDFNHTSSLRNLLYNNLVSNIDGVLINGSLKQRLPNNLNIRIEGVGANKLMLELRDLAFSNSSACSSGSGKPSRTLKALGLSDDEAFSSVRFGIGRFNTKDEIDYASNEIIEAVQKIRALNKQTFIHHINTVDQL